MTLNINYKRLIAKWKREISGRYNTWLQQENRMATVNTRQLMSAAAAAAVMNEVRKRRSNAAAPVIQMKNEVLVS